MAESTASGVDEDQCVFRKDRKCSDQIFIVEHLSETMKETKQLDFLTFKDLDKARENVKIEAVWQILEIFEVRGKSLIGTKIF